MTNAERNKLIEEISPCIFWDTDRAKLDAQEDKDYIIERVYTRGFEKDEIILWKIYSWRQIKNAVLKAEELNDRTIAYLSILLNIREKKFKCYGKNQFHLNCWKE